MRLLCQDCPNTQFVPWRACQPAGCLESCPETCRDQSEGWDGDRNSLVDGKERRGASETVFREQ